MSEKFDDATQVCFLDAPSCSLLMSFALFEERAGCFHRERASSGSCPPIDTLSNKYVLG